MSYKNKNRMKKILYIFIITVSFIFFISLTASAQTDAIYDEQVEMSGADKLIDSLPEDAKSVLEELGIDGFDFKSIIKISPRSLVNSLVSLIKDGMSGVLKIAAVLLGIVILSSVAESFTADDDKTKSAVSLISGIAVILILALPLSSLISAAVTSIKLSSGFMKVLIPVFAALVAASGNPLKAAGFNAFALFYAEGVSSSISGIITPASGTLLSMGAVGALIPEFKIMPIVETVRKTAITVFSGLAALFTGILSVKNILAGTADSVASKGVKLVIKSLVPIVGGALSDAYGSVVESVALLRGSVGIVGIIALSALNIPIIIEITLWIIALRCVSMCGDMIGLEHTSELTKTIAGILSLINACVIFNAVLMIISVGITMSSR